MSAEVEEEEEKSHAWNWSGSKQIREKKTKKETFNARKDARKQQDKIMKAYREKGSEKGEGGSQTT